MKTKKNYRSMTLEHESLGNFFAVTETGAGTEGWGSNKI